MEATHTNTNQQIAPAAKVITMSLNVGDTLINGASILEVSGNIVLAFFRNQYVTWQVKKESDGGYSALWGHYYGHDAQDAIKGFKTRAA